MPTRFVFLADTHLGTLSPGYQQRPAYPDRLPVLLEALCSWMASHGPVDFVLHGGDLVDAPTIANLRAAGERLRLTVPAYLCLGNHDLHSEGALAAWLDACPALFPGGQPSFDLEWPHGVLHVIPNHWDDLPFFWGDTLDAHLLPDQVKALGEALDRRPDVPHVLATHSPVFGVPPEQTGLPEPIHAPSMRFTEQILDLVRRHPCLQLVVGGHNHLNMDIEANGCRFATTSSFVEEPFQFKLVELGGDGIRVSSHSVEPLLSLR